jgi:hypothetical protein
MSVFKYAFIATQISLALFVSKPTLDPQEFNEKSTISGLTMFYQMVYYYPSAIALGLVFEGVKDNAIPKLPKFLEFIVIYTVLGLNITFYLHNPLWTKWLSKFGMSFFDDSSEYRGMYGSNVHFTKNVNGHTITDSNGNPKVYYGDPENHRDY